MRLETPEKELTFARVVPNMEPIEGSSRGRGNSGKGGRATDVGSDRIGRYFPAPGVLETADALNGILEAPRETNESVCMATRHLEPAEETLGYLALLGFVVGRVWDTGAGHTILHGQFLRHPSQGS